MQGGMARLGLPCKDSRMLVSRQREKLKFHGRLLSVQTTQRRVKLINLSSLVDKQSAGDSVLGEGSGQARLQLTHNELRYFSRQLSGGCAGGRGHTTNNPRQSNRSACQIYTPSSQTLIHAGPKPKRFHGLYLSLLSDDSKMK